MRTSTWMPTEYSRFLLVGLAALLLAPAPALAQSARAPIDSLLDRAEVRADSGSTAVALDLYGQVLRRDSTVEDAWRERAHLYAAQEEYAKAAHSMKRHHQLEATSSAYDLGNLAWYLVMAGNDLETAQNLARQAMERDLNDTRWPNNLGHAYLLDKQPRTAKFYYRKAMRRIASMEALDGALATFDTLVAQGHPKEALLKMKDWYHVTYLKEGREMSSGTGPLALLGTWITVVVGLVSLFQKGGEAMTENSQALVRDWLVREDRDNQLSNWPDSFKSLFDAVFTEHHFSWTCFYRSTFASAIIVTVLLLGMVGFGITTFYGIAATGLTDSIFVGVLYTLAFTIIFNSVLDYVSLFQTRWVIEYMAQTRYTAAHLGFLALDAFLTAGIFVLGVGSVQISLAGLEGASLWRALFLWMPGIVYDVLVTGTEPMIRAMFFSTFFTSIWIWLYALAGVAMRGTLSLFRGVDWMSNFFDVENRPVQALGLMLAILTTAGFLFSVPFAL